MDVEQAAALRKPFPKSAIGQLPKGGVMLDYVGHAATTDRLLAVDSEWTWEPLGLDEHGLPAIDAAGNLWIRLTVCGVTRIGCGDGKSMKERIGDAIRNAAMRFGVALDLWAKEDLHEISQPAQDDPPRSRGKSAADNVGNDVEAVNLTAARTNVRRAWVETHEKYDRDALVADFQQWAAMALEDADMELLNRYAKRLRGSDG